MTFDPAPASETKPNASTSQVPSLQAPMQAPFQPWRGHVLGLQRAAGNAAVTRLVERHRRTVQSSVSTPIAPVVARDKPRPTATSPSSMGSAEPSPWTPVVYDGTPSSLVAQWTKDLRALLPNYDLNDMVTVVSTGSKLVVFIAGRRTRDFPLAEGAAQLPEGVFMTSVGGGGVVKQLWVDRAKNDLQVFNAKTSQEQVQVDLIPEDQREDFRKLMHQGRDIVYLRSGAVESGQAGAEGGEGAGGEGEQTGVGGEGTGEGTGTGEGQGAPIPAWAWTQFQVVQDEVRSENRRITQLAESNAGESDVDGVARLLELGGIPERVVLGRDGKDVLLMVRVPGRRGALVLTEGQGPRLLWGRVQALARALYAGLSPSRHATAEDLVLGLSEGPAADADTVPPNTEAYPSEIVNHGPAIGIANALHRFSMRIDWSVEPEFGAIAAFGPRRFQWDIVRLRTGSGGLAERGDIRRSRRREAAGAELKEGFREIGEDTEASVDEELIDPGTAAVMATDAGIRSIGTLVGSFVSLASQPSNEQGVQWERPGTYVVRCISARPPLDREDAPPNPVVRAPSVALLPIRVMTATDMANRLTAPRDLRGAEAQLAKLLRRLDSAADEERPGLEEQIRETRAAVARLRQADEANISTHLGTTDRTVDEQLALTELLVQLLLGGSEPGLWAPEVERRMPAVLRDRGLTSDLAYGMVVGLHVELRLRGRTPETVIAELRRLREQVRQQLGAVSEVSGDFQGPTFRPHMSFVPRMDARSRELVTMLGEQKGSVDGNRRWTLVDLSTPGHHDSYEGSSRARGPAGHAEAIRNAIRKFAGGVPYGRGTLGVRIPAPLIEHVQGPIDVPQTLPARPDRSARWRQRLESLATAAATAALVVTGPAGIALGIVGGLAGGTVAAYRIHRRYEGGYLELDLETAMDVTGVVGAFVAPAGAWAGSVRATHRWVALADRVETGVRVFGYLQMGSQVFVIPITLAQELSEIGKDPKLSPGQRAARRALAFLKASRSGLELAVSGYQAVDEHAAGPRLRPGGDEAPGGAPAISEAPPPDLRRLEPETEGGSGAGPAPGRGDAGAGATAGGPRPAERPATGEAGAPRTRPGAGRDEAATTGEAGVGETGSPRHGTARTGDETDGSGERTAVGTGRGGSGADHVDSDVDANPVGRARAVELLQGRLGTLRRPSRERTSPLRAEELAARPRSADEAMALYDRAVHASSGYEVGLFYNPNTGEFAVRVGSEFQVGPPAGDGWQAIIHLHPNPENVVVRRLPAPADVLGAAHSAFRTGSHVEFVQSTRPDGSTGMARVEVTVEPRRIVVELPADPPSPGHAGEPGRRIEVDSPEAYAREYGGETTHMDPSSPLYEWVMRDLDAYYRARREGQERGGEGERTAVGTGGGWPRDPGTVPQTPATRPSPAQPEGGPSAAPGGGSPRPVTVREELVQGRSDVATRFAEADADFEEGGGQGARPSEAFDAAMAVLERAGMGEEGREAVEAMFRPALRQDELSGNRFRQVTERLQRIAELISIRPDLATAIGQSHYEGSIFDLRRQVATAYRLGETLDGQPLRGADPQGLADAIARMDRAFDAYLAAAARDPMERLFGLLNLREEVVRVGGILRSRESTFRATTTPGAPDASSIVPGVAERPLVVEATGRVSEPLARDLPGVGLEQYMLAPSDFASLPTVPSSLGERLARLLRGYHRAHLIGPGFGGELFEGLMLAPEHVNLRAQNEGVETFIRRAAEAGVDITLAARAEGRRMDVPLDGGGIEQIDVLTGVDYTITGTVGGGDPVTFTVRIDIGLPPRGTVEIRSTIPEGAPGADVLATFRSRTPVPVP